MVTLDAVLASQIPQSDPHAQTSRFSADALAFLSKSRMPLLACDSYKDQLFIYVYRRWQVLDAC